MAESLAATFGETLAPVLEKMGGDNPDRFQINLNGFSEDELNSVYDKVIAKVDAGVSFNEVDLTNFALLFGAKSLQGDFHEKEQEKITDIRDYFMLGMARLRVQSDETLNYHSGVYFHEYGEILRYKWNNLFKEDLMLDARKIKIYNQYTRNTYESIVERDRQATALVLSKEKNNNLSDDEISEDIKCIQEKQVDLFTLPEACYRELSLKEILDYSLYLVVEGDVQTYLKRENPEIQKFHDLLEAGGSFNPLDLRKAWWTDEKLARAKENLEQKDQPGVIIVYRGPRHEDKSQPA